MNAQANCCKRPSIARMDYTKHTPRDIGAGYDESPRINRVCTHCYTHWFGHPSEVKTYTRQQWDSWINETALA